MASPTTSETATVPPFQVWRNIAKKAGAAHVQSPSEECSSCELRSNDFFCGLSEAALKALERIKHAAAFPSGAILFMEGQAARGVYILCHGRVKLQTTNSDGRTLILKIAGPGAGLALNCVITGKPHDVTAEVLQPSRMTFIGREDFLKFLSDHGDACLHFAHLLGRDCHAAYELVRSIGLCQSAQERLARFLLDWSSGGTITDGAVRAKLGLTHEEMAQLIGASRETVTRTLSAFKRQRLIELNGSTLVLRNKAALESLAAD